MMAVWVIRKRYDGFATDSGVESVIIKNYLRSIFETDLLKNEHVENTKEGFELVNNISVRVLANDFRTIRGYTLVCAILEETCYFGLEENAHIKSDTELVRAVRPGLGALGGKLIPISSPYDKKDWCYENYHRYFGKKPDDVHVWNVRPEQ